MSLRESRLSLRELVGQGWREVQGQVLEMLKRTIEGLLEAERDRPRGRAARRVV